MIMTTLLFNNLPDQEWETPMVRLHLPDAVWAWFTDFKEIEFELPRKGARKSSFATCFNEMASAYCSATENNYNVWTPDALKLLQGEPGTLTKKSFRPLISPTNWRFIYRAGECMQPRYPRQYRPYGNPPVMAAIVIWAYLSQKAEPSPRVATPTVHQLSFLN